MDFLNNRSDLALRKEIQGIRDSYHHYWDLLAELLQNSRDAISRKRSLGHQGPFFILISVDPSRNEIAVFDNGVGIRKVRIHEMLAPFGGDKGGDGDEVGEKGVGLTYAVFSGDRFEISSKELGAPASSDGVVLGAQSWLHSRDGRATRPEFIPSDNETLGSDFFSVGEKAYSLDSFTRIRIGEIFPTETDPSIFSMSAAELRLLLRTRSAVGVTKCLRNEKEDVEFDTYLEAMNAGGSTIEPVESKHLVPHHLVAQSNRVRLEDVRSAFVAKADPIARRRYLGSKTVWDTKAVRIDGWEITVYGVMFPENDAFLQLSRDVLGINATEADEAKGAALFTSGIFVGTKGMPTGMQIPPKAGGRYPAYYKRCYFLVESPNLRFDLGRKSLHYRYVARLQDAVFSMFQKFEEIAQYQSDAKPETGRPDIPRAERQAQQQAAWTEALALPQLGLDKINYAKHPNAQEAAVSAVFHEMIGAGLLPRYVGLKTGYGERYDLHAHYVRPEGEPLRIVIEFKHALESLIRDLKEKSKYFADIDLLVAWDADEVALKTDHFDLVAVARGDFEGVTHLLNVPVGGIEPIPVILLRTLIDRMQVADKTGI